MQQLNIRITHIDGKLPNLALMRLSDWHKRQGDSVYFTRAISRELFEPTYDRVYASTIFKFSNKRIAHFLNEWPQAIIGGTGSDNTKTIEQLIGVDHQELDYSLYPEYTASIGFTQRGCRLRCKFCVVPQKEGKVRETNTVTDIWRGVGYPKNLYLLDNDFFGQENWLDRINEMRAGKFKICLGQGINVRLITDEVASALASIDYRAMNFKQRRIYTAWDNLGQEKIFFRGIDRLENAGINLANVTAYMLIGFAERETIEEIEYRFNKMVDRKIRPYPMLYDRSNRQLLKFQKWAIRGYHKVTSFGKFSYTHKPIDIDQIQFDGMNSNLPDKYKTQKYGQTK